MEEEEELDLEEVIKSLREEEDDDNDDDDDDDEIDEVAGGDVGSGEEGNVATEEKLEEAYATIRSLKSTLNEVNLLNAKLLFSNKLFRAHNLNESQKMRVIETFDRAQNVREIKLIYTTLAESMKAKTGTRKRVTEGMASKPTAATKPARKVISEGNDMANRFKKLANLL